MRAKFSKSSFLVPIVNFLFESIHSFSFLCVPKRVHSYTSKYFEVEVMLLQKRIQADKYCLFLRSILPAKAFPRVLLLPSVA